MTVGINDGHYFSDDASMLRDAIVQLIHGASDEPIYVVDKYTVINNHEDGSVEIILGICNASNDPHRSVKITISRAD